MDDLDLESESIRADSGSRRSRGYARQGVSCSSIHHHRHSTRLPNPICSNPYSDWSEEDGPLVSSRTAWPDRRTLNALRTHPEPSVIMTCGISRGTLAGIRPMPTDAARERFG